MTLIEGFSFSSFIVGGVSVLLAIGLFLIWVSREDTKEMMEESEARSNWKPSEPLMWWVDDLTHKHCGLVDDPVRGLATVPWPDSDKCYLAIDYNYHKKIYSRYKECIEELREGCKVYDQHVPSGSSSFRSSAQSLIDEYEKVNKLKVVSNEEKGLHP